MKRFMIIALLLAFGGEAEAREPSFRGTKSAVMRAYRVAKQHDYTFLKNDSQVRKFARLELIVRVKGSRHLELHKVSQPYARPALELFLRRLSAQYHGACGEKLVVTSLVRPTGKQPANASRYSVHPTGMAVDLRVPRKRSCRLWLERNLLVLEERGVAEVTQERRPHHYHIALFPNQYIRYLKKRGVRVQQ